MKLDALICALLLVLSALVPVVVFTNGGGESWSKRKDQAILSSRESDQLARDDESGKLASDPANLAGYLRMNALAEMETAKSYGYLADADRKILSATLDILGAQAALLCLLVFRRWKVAKGPRRET